MNKKKGLWKKIIKGILIFYVIILGFMLINSILYPNSDESKEVQVIFNASEYSRISTDELISKMGEPKSVEDWNNETSKGTFQMQIYTYEKDGIYYEFITADNAVVKVHFFGEWAYDKDKKDMPAMFGVEKSDRTKKTVDNGITYKLSPVSDKVAEFEVYNINKDEKTFDTVYVTYNLKYFD